MNAAREAATKEAVKWLSKIAGKNSSVKEIESMLNNLTNNQFDDYMQKLASGEEILPYIAPNLSDVKISLEQNLKIADELGHSFFERIWLTDDITGETHLTPLKYLVVDLPLKRLQQHLHKKISIQSANKSIDQMSGQVANTKDSKKGGKISFPELQILYSHGLEQTIAELFKFRGGDVKALNNLAKDALTNDLPSLKRADDGTTRVKSTETLSTLLRTAHLDNNL